MNLASCKNCGIVIDLDHVKFIPSEIPDDPKDESKRDEDGFLPMEVETSYNPNCIWARSDMGPLDTWQCPICTEYNAKGED